MRCDDAGVAELADAPDLGSGGYSREGSSPFARTTTRPHHSCSAACPQVLPRELKTMEENSLKTKVEVLESGAARLTVTIEAADIDARIKKTYKDFGKKYRFPGFRPGHVPRPVIDNHLGKEAVRVQVTDDLLNETLPLAIDQCDVVPISQARFDEVKDFVQEGADFEFAAEFEIKPTFTLSDYTPVRVEVPFKNATPTEIDEQLAQIAQYYLEYQDAEDDAQVEPEGSVDINLSVTDEAGEKIGLLSAENRLYELGRGLFPAALDEALVGLKKGESTTVTVDLATDPCMAASMIKRKAEDADKDAPRPVTFAATVVSVKRTVTPEITDEWVKDQLKLDSVEKLREQVVSSLEQQKAAAIPRILENNALYELQQRLEGEPPASMVADAEADLMRTFFSQLQSQGMTLDVYLQQRGLSSDQFKKDVHSQALDTVKQNLALDAWARHLELTVSDEDVMKEFQTSDAKDAEALYAEWKSQGRLHIVREGILRGKALTELLGTADVVEVEKRSSDGDEQGEAEAEAETSAEEPAEPADSPKAVESQEAADSEEAAGPAESAEAEAAESAEAPAVEKPTADTE